MMKVSEWAKARSAFRSSKNIFWKCPRRSVTGGWARRMDVHGCIQKTTLLVKVFIWEWRVGEKRRKESVGSFCESNKVVV